MRTKHYILSALIAQTFVALMNAIILITAVKDLGFYHEFYINVPSFISVVFMIIYYIKYINKFRIKRSVAAVVEIIANIAYFIIIYIDAEYNFFYINTVIIIFINSLFLMHYGTQKIKEFATSSSIAFVEIMLIISMGLSWVGLFYNFLDKRTCSYSITISSVLLVFAIWRILILHNKRSKSLFI